MITTNGQISVKNADLGPIVIFVILTVKITQYIYFKGFYLKPFLAYTDAQNESKVTFLHYLTHNLTKKYKKERLYVETVLLYDLQSTLKFH